MDQALQTGRHTQHNPVAADKESFQAQLAGWRGEVKRRQTPPDPSQQMAPVVAARSRSETEISCCPGNTRATDHFEESQISPTGVPVPPPNATDPREKAPRSSNRSWRRVLRRAHGRRARDPHPRATGNSTTGHESFPR